jgi:bacteriocin-like protein
MKKCAQTRKVMTKKKMKKIVGGISNEPTYRKRK